MKKAISLITVIAILFTMCIPTVFGASATFSDVADTTQKQAIQKLVDLGYIKGYPNGTFKPNAPVLRSELVRIINQVFKYSTAGKNTFKDVTGSQWFYKDILYAQKMGYISGYPDKTFKPNSYVTREQMCVIINNIEKYAKPSTNVQVKDAVSIWAKDAVNKMLTNKIFSLESGNTFRATKNITRAEVCIALAKFVDNETASVDENTNNGSSGTSVSTGGSTSGSSASSSGSGSSSSSSSSGSSSGSGSSSSSSGGISYSTMMTSLDVIKNGLQSKVIPKASANEKKVAQMILDGILAYEKDNSYDYKTAMNSALDAYKNLTSTEKSELLNLVNDYCYTNNILNVFRYFNIDISKLL